MKYVPLGGMFRVSTWASRFFSSWIRMHENGRTVYYHECPVVQYDTENTVYDLDGARVVTWDGKMDSGTRTLPPFSKGGKH